MKYVLNAKKITKQINGKTKEEVADLFDDLIASKIRVDVPITTVATGISSAKRKVSTNKGRDAYSLIAMVLLSKSNNVSKSVWNIIDRHKIVPDGHTHSASGKTLLNIAVENSKLTWFVEEWIKRGIPLVRNLETTDIVRNVFGDAIISGNSNNIKTIKLLNSVGCKWDAVHCNLLKPENKIKNKIKANREYPLWAWGILASSRKIGLLNFMLDNGCIPDDLSKESDLLEDIKNEVGRGVGMERVNTREAIFWKQVVTRFSKKQQKEIASVYANKNNIGATTSFFNWFKSVASDSDWEMVAKKILSGSNFSCGVFSRTITKIIWRENKKRKNNLNQSFLIRFILNSSETMPSEIKTHIHSTKEYINIIDQILSYETKYSFGPILAKGMGKNTNNWAEHFALVAEKDKQRSNSWELLKNVIVKNKNRVSQVVHMMPFLVKIAKLGAVNPKELLVTLKNEIDLSMVDEDLKSKSIKNNLVNRFFMFISVLEKLSLEKILSIRESAVINYINKAAAL